MRLLRRIALILGAVCATIVVLLAVLLGALWIDHNRESTLAKPTGPYAVGRTSFFWIDPKQQEPLAPQPGTPREAAVWIWYPAAHGSTALPAEYFPAPLRNAIDKQRGAILSKFLARSLARVQCHSLQDPDLSPQQRTYPVVLMRPGLAVETLNDSTLAEDLASHGSVVVGFDAPFRTFSVVQPDGKVIQRTAANNADLVGGDQKQQVATTLLNAWSSDMSFVMDNLERLNVSDPTGRFQGRLDLQHVGAFGHSLGGASALQFCHDDGRCKTGIDIDGEPLGSVIRDGVHQPFMFLLSDHSREPQAETRPVEANIQSIYDRLPPDHRSWIVIRGAEHYGFVDLTPLPMRVAHTLGIVRLGSREQIAVTTDCIHKFFDVYLKGMPSSELDSLDRHPEIVHQN